MEKVADWSGQWHVIMLLARWVCHELLRCLPVLAVRLNPKRADACSDFAEHRQRHLQRVL
jgi:hypothetical protein